MCHLDAYRVSHFPLAVIDSLPLTMDIVEAMNKYEYFLPT